MKLLEPLDIRNIQISNRLVLAPMSRMQANEDGTVSERMPLYYSNYARRGVGLLMTEALYTDKISGRAYFNQPGLCTAAQRDTWRTVVSAVHDMGGRIFAQLQHGGRLAEPGLNPQHIAASDGIAAGNTWQTGRPNAAARAATTSEIKQIIECFERAASYAVEAGFDGIEIHGARGYLIDDFLSASTNRREDEYGGSLENRLRLPVQIVECVRGVVGKRPISFNMSLYKMDDLSYTPPGGEAEMTSIASALETAGVDLLHVSTRKALRDEQWGEPLVKVIGAAVTRARVIANGGLKTLDDCSQCLALPGVEAVSLARALLSNPDWLSMALERRPLETYVPGMEREALRIA
ncbi:NADH:flavin oxidoreductase [Allopusillimonas soli]|uniref:NADH:flavin oxidoreductase n=1 Tax=Allopusillimonas soli TaxID=659016 RepID=A0A853FFS8_9BURK|nr:NADH:flavin oxidoreductase [Allopusillimonas soli]NYT38729.1 NADH:flavin oxidoreductase [Allopusillimonas soli]TEA71577.1 NADH:flavin oxidoreductase [Allopusillimonas soli]